MYTLSAFSGLPQHFVTAVLWIFDVRSNHPQLSESCAICNVYDGKGEPCHAQKCHKEKHKEEHNEAGHHTLYLARASPLHTSQRQDPCGRNPKNARAVACAGLPAKQSQENTCMLFFFASPTSPILQTSGHQVTGYQARHERPFEGDLER
eukprot:1716461-Amphidinium_carterae.3